jgi:hypothetical protein
MSKSPEPNTMPTEKCEQNGEKKKPVSSVVNYNKTTVWIG